MMTHFLYKSLFVFATWPMVCLLFLAFVVCSRLFNWRQKQLGSQTKVLDASFWYTPSQVRQLFETLGDKGRRLYAVTEITLDLVFPFVYGTLFGSFIVRLFSPEKASWLALIPLVAAATDLFENSIIAYLALSYDGQESPLSWVAATFTMVKSMCFGASLMIILIGGILGFF